MPCRTHPLRNPASTADSASTLLKSDLFGTVRRIHQPDPGGGDAQWVVWRDTRPARWWLGWLSRRLARREAIALNRLRGVAGVPALIAFDGSGLRREWIPGEPMQQMRPADPAYFRAAGALVRRLHCAGVVHNDLAKEPNWLVTPDGRPALVDFQLALVSRSRSRLFRMLARDDIRHLLKHKRRYCAHRLTTRERRILATPSPVARVWMATGKKVYLLVTRRLLGWADREGAGDRELHG